MSDAKVSGPSRGRPERRPLVSDRFESLGIEEDRRVSLSTLPLKRERNEVAERPPGHKVLSREETVVAGQVHFSAFVHCFTKKMDTKLAGGHRGDWSAEEDPDVRAVSRARTLQGS
jgi:hypothetical protein